MKSKRRIAKGLLLVVLAVFIGVSLASFDQRDWGVFWNVRNLCGPIGAVLGGVLRMLFGAVFSWFFPVFMLYWGITSIRGASLREDSRRIICASLFLWILSAMAAAFGNIDGAGLVGARTHDFLELVSGRIGSVLILFGAFIVTAVILFFGSMKAFARRLGSLSLPRFAFPRSVLGRGGLRKRLGRKRKPVPEVLAPPGKEAGSAEAEIVSRKPKPAEVVTDTPKIVDVSPGSDAFPKPDMEPLAQRRGMMESTPLPDLSLLGDYDESKVSYSKDDLIARSEIIESKLKDYGLSGKVSKVLPGPVVTTFEFIPAPGVRVSQIASRADDIALALAARAIRIQAPIPGRGAVGIEVPNPEPMIVPLRELMEHYPAGKEGLWVAVGKTVTGEPYFTDIADMPHLLIAGATGSGKSVCINSIICSLLFHHTPASCRLILVDPKRLELISYKEIPHLLHPVITEAKLVLKVLQWLTIEMDRRYRLLASVGVKNIQSFNEKVEQESITNPETGEKLVKLPYYLTIIDELADIMVTMGNEIYPPITRLSQMARAVGIHLVFATQRPSVDIVTGLIKANFPCRIAFQVTSKTDSRTILDINGAEKLLGNGDMLYLPKNLPAPIRIQGAFISESEAENVASYWRDFSSVSEELDLDEEVTSSVDEDADIDDDLFEKAKELVIIHQQGSISLLQRRLRVGYARAARLIDMLEQANIVGPFEGSKARRVLVSREYYDGS
jgi:S-DNA-T family DNA segregation ATPase FtsK/SpoIIIE